MNLSPVWTKLVDPRRKKDWDHARFRRPRFGTTRDQARVVPAASAADQPGWCYGVLLDSPARGVTIIDVVKPLNMELLSQLN